MPQKKILVTGACGFVGRNLVPYLANAGHNVTGLDIAAKGDVIACDVSDGDELTAILHNTRPDVIVHCAARKNLPDCEENKAATFASNTLSTEMIAAYAKVADAKVVYLSSDVVFDGQAGNYEPTDTVRPINWYGKTKTFSEIILRAVDNAAICRTALIIGELNEEYKSLLNSELGNEILVNQTLLPQYIYKRLQDGKTVRMPASIISNPTPVSLLCKIISKVIERDACGVFHATGPDALSRYEVGLLIAETFGFDKGLVIEDDANISPLRPRNISMDSMETFKELGINPQDWRLRTYLANGALYD